MCVKNLGFTQEQIEAPGFDLLTALGFSRSQIEEANAYVCGTMTVEGAPHLKPEHLPVFDCANRCGKHGQRFLAAEAHIRMMAAAQPFVVGAISKTINMPRKATIQDVKEAYQLSWRLDAQGQRAVPRRLETEPALNTVADAPDLDGDGRSRTGRAGAEAGPVQIAEKIVYRYIAHRRRLPDRRAGYTQKSRIGNHKIYLRTGEYEDGTLGEIFIDMHKEGAAFRSMTNCFAIAISLGLQHGVPLEEYVDAFLFTRFEPNGVVVGNPHIKMTTSIIDYIFRELAITYLGRHDLAHVDEEDLRGDAIHRDERGAGVRVGGGRRAASGAGRAAADAEGLRHAAERTPAAARGKRQRPQEQQRRRHGRRFRRRSRRSARPGSRATRAIRAANAVSSRWCAAAPAANATRAARRAGAAEHGGERRGVSPPCLFGHGGLTPRRSPTPTPAASAG